MHVQAFVFDDDVLLSGANLADTYFSDRLDRYGGWCQLLSSDSCPQHAHVRGCALGCNCVNDCTAALAALVAALALAATLCGHRRRLAATLSCRRNSSK